MGQRQAEVELTFLEYIVLSGSDRRWRFKFTSNPHFHELINRLVAGHLYQVREVYFTLTSGDYSKQHALEISDEGMWFLSHLFTNWTEMFEKARVHTSGTHAEAIRCSNCGLDKVAVRQCVHCSEVFCGSCYRLHEEHVRQQRTPPFQVFNFHFEKVRADDYVNLNDFFRNASRRQSTQGTFTHTFTQTQGIPQEVRNAHALLGITKEAPTEGEIRQAFRTKVKALHPDRGGQGGDLDNLTKAKERALKFIGVEL